MKVLCYMESPYIATGTSQGSSHILPILLERGYDIEVVAINHFEDEHKNRQIPFKIHPCPNNDAYNLEKIKERIAHGEYDLLFLYSDVGQLNAMTDVIRDARLRRDFRVIMYSCVDCDSLNAQTLECLTIADYPVMYSHHSKKIAHKYFPSLNIQTIYHGCEPEIFYPFSQEERSHYRKQTFGIDDDFFLVLSVARNQWRKDPGRSLMIFHEFHKVHPKSAIYMHMKMRDIGGSLPDAAQMIGMRLLNPEAEIIFTGPSFLEQVGVPREMLNKVYNCADVMISTSTGEGFGLTTTEAMSAACPLVVPRNTSFIELIGAEEERGYMAESGGDIDHLAIPYGISDNPRALVHSKSMLAKMEHIFNHREEAKEKASLAREWTLHHTWEQVKEAWDRLLARATS